MSDRKWPKPYIHEETVTRVQVYHKGKKVYEKEFQTWEATPAAMQAARNEAKALAESLASETTA
jgi:hypothetical protein